MTSDIRRRIFLTISNKLNFIHVYLNLKRIIVKNRSRKSNCNRTIGRKQDRENSIKIFIGHLFSRFTTKTWKGYLWQEHNYYIILKIIF